MVSPSMTVVGWLVAHHIASLAIGLVSAGFSLAVLGQRRPTGSAYAWLLVILLVPYLGIPLYVVFGGRKFRQRARSKSPLTVLASGAASDTTAATIAWLDDGVCAYEAFLREIRGATRSIRIVTFVVGDDETGQTLLEALTLRAAAGVEVRLLIDDFLRIHAPHGLLRKLEAAGGKVCRFMPLVHIPFRGHGNLRNHRKIALFDGERAIVGGMNLAREYMGPSPRPERWRDLSTLVTGAAVGALDAIFRADWEFASREALAHAPSVRDPAPSPCASCQAAPTPPPIPSTTASSRPSSAPSRASGSPPLTSSPTSPS